MFPLHSAGSCNHTHPITVLKLHGSLNWVVRLQSQRPTLNFLTGNSAAPGSIHLLPSRTVGARNTFVRTGQGRSQWETWPVVVPPVYAKQALRSTIAPVWDQAKRSLEQADRVVFFGYSLPQLDVEAEKLFERALARNQALTSVDVVDPAPAAAARYAAISPGRPLRWHPNLTQVKGVAITQNSVTAGLTPVARVLIGEKPAKFLERGQTPKPKVPPTLKK